jgi:hypothetical protein
MKTARVSALVLLALASSCQKEIDLPLVPAATGGFCLNPRTESGPTAASPYQNLVWADEFNGPEPGESPGCYSKEPTCIVRLDEFRAGPCPADFDRSRIAGLNKCKWNVWAGFSFWDKANKSAYHPAAVSVENGSLVLGARWRKDRAAYRCGVRAGADSASLDYYDRECLYDLGAVDSNDVSDGTRGRDVKYGRVEIRARIGGTRGNAPAFWMWPVSLGHGNPYAYGTWDRWHVGEQDILETHQDDQGLRGFQTYHDWGPPHLSKGSADFAIPPGTWTRFGVERLPGKVRFYVNDCYTHEVAQGQGGMKLADYPNFLLLSMGLDHWAAGNDELDRARTEIDYVRIFE